MQAIVMRGAGGPEVLELADVAAPVPGKSEVRVRVRATAVNRADLLQRMGGYPPPRDAPADILGLEFAGEVDAVGACVFDLAVGDRVFGLVGGGAYAEHLVVHERTVARLPDAVGVVEGAAIPEAFLTAYDAMVLQAGLTAGESVVVHAVGSGVGTAAVQIARAIGARSLGTARTANKLERAAALGLDAGICVQDACFSERVLELTGGRGVDVVLDLAGGAYVAEGLKCLAPKGRLVLVGLVAGGRAELDLSVILRKRITLRGTVMRSRPLEERIAAAQVLGRNIAPLVARGVYRAVIDQVLPLAQAGRAHALLAANESFGKIVLTT